MAENETTSNLSFTIPRRRLVVGLIPAELTYTETLYLQEVEKSRIVYSQEFSTFGSEVNVRFSRTFGGLGKANVTIYNMHPFYVDRFTQTSYLPRKPNKIVIYAGYEEGGATPETIDPDDDYGLSSPIYEGYILWAAPTGITDIAFQIEAMEEFSKMNCDISVSPDDGGNHPSTSSFDIIEKALGEVGLSTNYDAFPNSQDIDFEYGEYLYPKGVNFVNYSFSGKVADFLQKEIFRFNRMQFIIEGNTVFLRPNSEDENLILTQTQLPIDHFISGRLQEDIDGVEGVKSAFDTLMIGAPSVSYYGANIRVLYTKKLKAGDRFKLISRLYPKFNFVYEIINIKYDLQLRGQNFYMDLECIRSRNSK